MSCIGPPVKRQFGYLFKAKEKVKELIDLEKDVEAMKVDAENQIDADERVGKKPTEEAKLWIKKVQDIEDELTTVKNDYNQRGRCWPNCWSRYKIGRRASKLLEKLKAPENKRPDVLTRVAPPASVVPQMSTTSNVVGNMITINKKKICGYLKEEETDGVIGIQGMGGVGKTTLLKAINDNFLSNNGNSVTNKLFDHVIFIVVSKKYELENLQKTIFENLRLRPRDGVSQAQSISEYLKEKNFLLLLDDIWEVVQLEDLGIPYPCQVGSSSSSGRRFRRKVVFTTRSLQVCKDMNCDERNIIKMECLEADEAWDLFKKTVGERIINLPCIMSVAEEVTKKCGGLPLALVVIGKAMATKKSLEEWESALTQLKKAQHSKIPGIEKEDKYFLRLKFSYDSLPDDKMRERFLCCSLWPEDFKIKKNELIMCWMGLGLIDDFENIKEAYDEGHTLIGSLIVASLLQDVQGMDDVIKVHDVIRDLALWIACDSGKDRNKWLVKAGVGLEAVPNAVVANWGVAERVSLMRNRIEDLPSHLPSCDNLSTLLLQKNWLTLIPAGFFNCMPNLTYLDLSGNRRIQEFPKEICCLEKLRYLNLSKTRISSLPKELGGLINLKYLLVRNTEIEGEVNRKIIERLSYLDLYPNGFVETEELLHLPLLKGVGMKITSEHALQQLSCVVASILDLNIELDMGGDSLTTSKHLHHLLSSTCTKLSLRNLMITKCHSIRELVDVHLPRLESLELSGLENLTEIVWTRSVVPGLSECFQRLRYLSLIELPKLAMICDNNHDAVAVIFPSLEYLHVEKCNGLKDITWVLHLPCLQLLYLSDCEEMEQLVVIGGGEGRELEVTKPTFPSLRYLYLTELPKLAMICDNNHDAAVIFPSLERLHVEKCNELKDITWVLHLPCLEDLRLDDCKEMEQLVVIGGGEGRELEVTKPTFPKLRILELWGLPKLSMICDNNHDAAAAAVNFPSLEVLSVRNCKELKRLPFNNNNCRRLKTIYGSREWWEGIEWEDQSAQASLLQPFFEHRPSWYN